MKQILLIFCCVFVIAGHCFAQQSKSEGTDALLSLRPTITYKEKAKYTQDARDNGIHGTVLLSLVFGREGNIYSVTPITTLPNGLTEMSVEAAKKIRFTPAIKNGTPVSVRMSVEFSFALHYGNKRHQQRVIAFAFPLLTSENVDKLVQAFNKYSPDTHTTDIWLVVCEGKGVKQFPKPEQAEFRALQFQAVQFLLPQKQKIVERLMKKWDNDKIEDADLYTLDTLIFEGISLSPTEKQTRFRELHNQAVAAGLQQFKAK